MCLFPDSLIRPFLYAQFASLAQYDISVSLAQERLHPRSLTHWLYMCMHIFIYICMCVREEKSERACVYAQVHAACAHVCTYIPPPPQGQRIQRWHGLQ